MFCNGDWYSHIARFFLRDFHMALLKGSFLKRDLQFPLSALRFILAKDYLLISKLGVPGQKFKPHTHLRKCLWLLNFKGGIFSPPRTRAERVLALCRSLSSTSATTGPKAVSPIPMSSLKANSLVQKGHPRALVPTCSLRF